MKFARPIEELKAATRELPAPAITEIVLKTARFDELRQWYEIVLGVTPFFVRERPETPSWTGAMGIAFFRLQGTFPFSQVFGIFELTDTAAVPTNDPGLHHGQIRHARLEDLFDRYERLKAGGILPIQTWNHGPSTSFYYVDPDGNRMELSGPNYDTEAEYLGYFETEAYRRNISGIEIDPDAFIERFRNGTSKAELVLIG